MRGNWATRLMLVSFATTIALGTMPLMGLRPMVLLILVWLVIAVARWSFSAEKAKAAWKPALVLSLPFLLMFVDLLRGPMDGEAWRLVERSAALLIFPLGLLVLKAPSNFLVRERTVLVFVICTAVFAILANVPLAGPVTSAMENGVPFDVAYRSAFAQHTGVHPPYAAYWCFTAALFGLNISLSPMERPSSIPARSMLAVAILIGVIAGLLLGSRMPVIGFAAGLVVLLFGQLPRARAAGYAAGGVLLLALSLMFVPGIRQRAVELAVTMSDPSAGAPVNSITVRTPIIHCSFLELEDHWLLGLGQADVQPALDACYRDLGHTMLAGTGHGPHDQLIHWWLSFGLAGLAAFLLLFGWSGREARRHKDHVHLAFLVLMVLCSLTEDLLTRQWGVVLFAFFNTLFIAAQRTRGLEPSQ